MENEKPLGAGEPKSAYKFYPDPWLITFMFCGETSRDPAKSSSWKPYFSCYPSSWEQGPVKLTGYLNKIHHALEEENRIYHPKYPVQNLELLLMQRNWKPWLIIKTKISDRNQPPDNQKLWLPGKNFKGAIINMFKEENIAVWKEELGNLCREKETISKKKKKKIAKWK